MNDELFLIRLGSIRDMIVELDVDSSMKKELYMKISDLVIDEIMNMDDEKYIKFLELKGVDIDEKCSEVRSIIDKCIEVARGEKR